MKKADELVITRIFDAPRELVWKAWTDPEMAKKWWGPEGFTAPSIKIDLRVGGKYIFCMHGPKGSEWDKDMYSAGIYKEIVPDEKLVITDYFSNEEGEMTDPTAHGVDPNFPKESTVMVLFEQAGEEKTKLSIIYRPESEKQAEIMRKVEVGK